MRAAARHHRLRRPRAALAGRLRLPVAAAAAPPLCAAAAGRCCGGARALSGGAEAPVHLPSERDSPELAALRHTAAHVLAQAVQTLFPAAQATLGPWTEDGFYYDFAHPEPFSSKDLKRIKKEMDRIIKRRLPLVREVVAADDARSRLVRRPVPTPTPFFASWQA